MAAQDKEPRRLPHATETAKGLSQVKCNYTNWNLARVLAGLRKLKEVFRSFRDGVLLLLIIW